MLNDYTAGGPTRAPDTLQLLQNFPPGRKHICVTKKDNALETLDGEFNRKTEKDTAAHLHPLISATSLVVYLYS